MTTIYFVRHAEADRSTTEDRNRPLTAKGQADCALVTEFLQNKNIDVIISSPYKRAVDTIADFAESLEMSIEKIEDFRERERAWMEDMRPYTEKQWADFSYKHPGGECLAEVQDRNIAALNDVLNRHKNMNIVICTHGFALSTIINFFDKNYGFDEWMEMAFINPWVVKMVFEDGDCVAIEKINLFEL